MNCAQNYLKIIDYVHPLCFVYKTKYKVYFFSSQLVLLFYQPVVFLFSFVHSNYNQRLKGTLLKELG